MLQAYISGALTDVADRDAARRLYERLAEICARAGVHAYVPHLENDPVRHADVPPELVYERDLQALTNADVVVAYVGAPSLGVGAELALAIAARRCVVAMHRPDQRVSRFILGMLRDAGQRELAVWDDDLDAELEKVLKELPSTHRGAGGDCAPPLTSLRPGRQPERTP